MKEISYNIIDSVKGGSGKTSLSLMLAMIAQNTLNSKGGDSTVQTLVLDMDMQGSALAGMLFGNTKPGENGRAEQFLDQRILSYYSKSSKGFISYPEFNFSDGKESGAPVNSIKIGVAMASPKMEDRLVFRASSRHNYSSQITYTAFTAGLREVLTELNTFCAAPPQYLFFDMPPNSNGYSDAVLELLLQKESTARKWKESACNYFALTTLDRSHINSTLEWFKSFVNENRCFPDHFFFTFNNVPGSLAEMDPKNNLIAEAMHMIRTQLLAILRDGNNDCLDRIYFLGINYQAHYLQTCCEGDGLGISGAMPLRLEILTPVSFLEPVLKAKKTATKITVSTAELIQLLGFDSKAGGCP